MGCRRDPPVEVEDLDVVDHIQGAGVARDEALALGEGDLGLVPGGTQEGGKRA